MIHIVTALLCEAQPLIHHYKLKRNVAIQAFSVYESHKKNESAQQDIRLIISGIGKVNSAAACAYLFAHFGDDEQTGWLNVGIAGHADFEIGAGYLAHKITDNAHGKSWYPTPISTLNTASAPLLTVDQVDPYYSVPALFDMEAAGFFEATSRFAIAELNHCYKVVSDNLSSPAHAIEQGKEYPLRLMGARLDEMITIINAIQDLSKTLQDIEKDPAQLSDYLERWHFTTTQSHQLRRSLIRLETLEHPADIHAPDGINQMKNAKAVLKHLNALIHHTYQPQTKRD